MRPVETVCVTHIPTYMQILCMYTGVQVCIEYSICIYCICVYVYAYIIIYIYTYIYIYIRRPLPERERVSSHCHQPILCNPADPNQPLLQYLAISHAADCNLPILQNAACFIASS